ncbi:MAG: alpha/beta hydrolase [Acidimicrobiia bacterium]
MSFHPQLLRSVQDRPALVRLNAETLPARRAEFTEQLVNMRKPEQPSVSSEDHVIDGADGQPMTIRVYRNTAVAPDTIVPLVVWFHGGAFIMGDLDAEDLSCRMACQRLGAVVVAADYRLAPEHPFPAGVEDCYTSLCWATAHAAELGVDATRVAIAGNSAGGGLTAAVALMARDRGGPAIAYQFLGIPMLDDRCSTMSMQLNDEPYIWNTQLCRDSWLLYLGPDYSGEVPPYAAPARATRLDALPPAYVLINEKDPLADEGLAYAQRLSHAGVRTEVHVVPGAWHGFAMYMPKTGLARRMNDAWLAAMAEALDVELRD